MQHEQLLEDIENASVSDLDLTQVSDQTDDLAALVQEIEQSATVGEARLGDSTSPTSSASTKKTNSPPTTSGTTIKKGLVARKKKISDVR
jgi:hypothetical protein